MVRISPKRFVFEMVGCIEGKSAIRAAREFQGRGRNVRGYHFWARGYFVSIVEIDERMIRECIDEREIPRVAHPPPFGISWLQRMRGPDICHYLPLHAGAAGKGCPRDPPDATFLRLANVLRPADTEESASSPL